MGNILHWWVRRSFVFFYFYWPHFPWWLLRSIGQQWTKPRLKSIDRGDSSWTGSPNLSLTPEEWKNVGAVSDWHCSLIERPFHRQSRIKKTSLVNVCADKSVFTSSIMLGRKSSGERKLVGIVHLATQWIIWSMRWEMQSSCFFLTCQTFLEFANFNCLQNSV